MKNILFILIIIIIFIMGIKLGDDTFNQNQLFEMEKEQFEQQITNPDNSYQNHLLVPPENIVNKVAHKIDNTIDKMVEKFKDLLKKL